MSKIERNSRGVDFGGGEVERTNYLLVIGINEYADAKIPSLKNARKDAEAIVEILSQRYTFEQIHHTLLFDADASFDKISRTFREYAKKLTSNDNLLIYFAGHGFLDKTMNIGYLLPSDATDGKYHTFLPNSTILDWVRAIKSHHTCLILDSCFSGSILRKASEQNKRAENAERYPSRICFASGMLEEVSDGYYNDNSPFAKAILNFLTINDKKALPIFSLFDDVKTAVPNNSEQQPCDGRLFKTNDMQGEMVLYLRDTLQFEWEKLQQNPTLAGLEKYVRDFPNSLHIEKAKEQILEIQREIDWKEAQAVHTISAYHIFWEKYQGGKYADLAFSALKSSEEKSAWEKALRLDTRFGYADFIQKYRDSEFVPQAFDKLAYFKLLDEEERVVRERLAKKTEEKRLEKIALEKEAWERANKLDTSLGFAEFLQKFSDSEFAPQAKEMLAFFKLLEEEEKERLEKLALEKAEKERLEKLALEKAEKERLEKLALEKAEKERLEKLALEKAEKERLEKLALEKAEKERLEKIALEKAEKERLEKLALEKAEKERLEKIALEKAEKECLEKLALEKAEKERLERLERALEKQEKDRLEKIAAEKTEKVEKERLAKEAEQKRLAELEKQRLAKEAEQKRLAELERQRLAKEAEEKLLAELEKQRLAKEAEQKRLTEMERQRLAKEAEKKRLEELERQRLAKEAEQKRIAEIEKQRLAKEAAENKIICKNCGIIIEPELSLLAKIIIFVIPFVFAFWSIFIDWNNNVGIWLRISYFFIVGVITLLVSFVVLSILIPNKLPTNCPNCNVKLKLPQEAREYIILLSIPTVCSLLWYAMWEHSNSVFQMVSSLYLIWSFSLLITHVIIYIATNNNLSLNFLSRGFDMLYIYYKNNIKSRGNNNTTRKEKLDFGEVIEVITSFVIFYVFSFLYYSIRITLFGYETTNSFWGTIFILAIIPALIETILFTFSKLFKESGVLSSLYPILILLEIIYPTYNFYAFQTKLLSKPTVVEPNPIIKPKDTLPVIISTSRDTPRIIITLPIDTPKIIPSHPKNDTTKKITLPPKKKITYIEPEMVHIEGGSFEMGDVFSEGAINERPLHSVSLSNFEIGKYEVSFTEYDLFCDVTKRKKPSDKGWGRGKRPVINVTWNDATAYCQWLSQQTGKKYRLPTEAEWEFSARERGKKIRFGNGKNIANAFEMNFDAQTSSQTYSKKGQKRVGTVPTNELASNNLGLYNMSGNVWEWCVDTYDPKFYTNKKNLKNPQNVTNKGNKVFRGGSWVNGASYCRVSNRDFNLPNYSNYNIGFRVVR